MPVIDNQENSNKCICPTCPSYDDCMRGKNETLYCARGKTECEVVKKGCVCGSCPVHMENKLTKWYYCLSGAE